MEKMAYKIKNRKKRIKKSEAEKEFEAWVERVEEGLGRKLTRGEKEKEKRLMGL